MSKNDQRTTVFLLGPTGSFSDQAARTLGKIWRRKYVPSFVKLFIQVRRGGYALAPIRNKLIGEIEPVVKFFKKHPVIVLKKIRLPVSFVLVAKKKISLPEITDLYIPKIVFEQCDEFVLKNLSHARLHMENDSTSAGCAKIHRMRKATVAAVGSAFAARRYSLKILARAIENRAGDWTEFVLFNLKKRERGARPKYQVQPKK